MNDLYKYESLRANGSDGLYTPMPLVTGDTLLPPISKQCLDEELVRRDGKGVSRCYGKPGTRILADTVSCSHRIALAYLRQLAAKTP